MISKRTKTMPKGAKKMKKASINIKIDTDLRQRLDEMASKQFRSRNKMIEMILKDFVSRQSGEHKQQAEGTAEPAEPAEPAHFEDI